MQCFWFLLDSLSTRAGIIALLLFVIVPFSALLFCSAIDPVTADARGRAGQDRTWPGLQLRRLGEERVENR